jgi:hypothetical protein
VSESTKSYEMQNKILIMALNNTPAWQLLLVLDAYARKHPQAPPPLLLTRYPYWMPAYQEEVISVPVDPLVFGETLQDTQWEPDRKINADHYVALMKAIHTTDYDQSIFGRLRKYFEDANVQGSGRPYDWARIASVAAALRDRQESLFENIWALDDFTLDDSLEYIAITQSMKTDVDQKDVDFAVRGSTLNLANLVKERQAGEEQSERTGVMKTKNSIGKLAKANNRNSNKRRLKDRSDYFRQKSVELPKRFQSITSLYDKYVSNNNPNPGSGSGNSNFGSGFGSGVWSFQMANTHMMMKPQMSVAMPMIEARRASTLQSTASAQQSLMKTIATEEKIPYSLFGSSLQSQPGILDESSQRRFLTKDDPLDKFVYTVGSLAFHLSKLPSDAESWIFLHATDNTSVWLDLAFQGKMELNISLTSISNFRITIGKNLVFSTDKAGDVLGIEQIVSNLGLSAWTDFETMILGLTLKSIADLPHCSTRDIFQLIPAAGTENQSLSEKTSSILAPLYDLQWQLNKDSRNAIWLTPADSHSAMIRLEFQLVSAVSGLSDFFESLFPTGFDASITVPRLIYTKETSLLGILDDPKRLVSKRSLAMTAVLALSFTDSGGIKASANLRLNLELLQTGSVQFDIMTFDNPNDFTSLAKSLVVKGLGLSQDVMQFDDVSTKDILGQVWFRRLKLAVGQDSKIESASLAIEVSSKVGKDETKADNVPLLLQVSYQNNSSSAWTLSGGLWFAPPPDIPFQIMSDFEYCKLFLPLTPNPATAIKLSNLIPGNSTTLPKGVPDSITDASFTLSADFFGITGTIEDCTLQSAANDKDDDVPPFSLKKASLGASYSFGSKVLQLELSFRGALRLPNGTAAPDECSLWGRFEYSKQKWQVSAQVTALNLGMLYDLFDKDHQDVLYELLKGIEIKNLTVSYGAEGETPKLTCDGDMMLGKTQHLRIHYEYPKGGDWSFTCFLTKENIKTNVTVGTILESMLDSGNPIVSDLPDFFEGGDHHGT